MRDAFSEMHTAVPKIKEINKQAKWDIHSKCVLSMIAMRPRNPERGRMEGDTSSDPLRSRICSRLLGEPVPCRVWLQP